MSCGFIFLGDVDHPYQFGPFLSKDEIIQELNWLFGAVREFEFKQRPNLLLSWIYLPSKRTAQ